MSINTASDSWRKNLGYQWTSTLFVAVFGFLVSVLLARKLGVEGFGDYSYILSLAGIFLIIQDGGYKTLIFRESVDDSAQSLLSSGLVHVASVTSFGILLVLLLQPHNWTGILTAIFCMGLVVVTTFVSSLLKGRGDFKSDAIWKIVIRSMSACGIFSVLFFLSNIICLSLLRYFNYSLMFLYIPKLLYYFY